MLKKYGKAIEQPQAHCLSIFTVSRRMGSPESERAGGGRRAGGRAARALCWAERPSLPSWGPRPPSTRSPFSFHLDPTPPIHGAWAAERGWATGTEGLRSRRWRGPATRRPGRALLAVCALGGRASGCSAALGRLRSPHLTSCDLATFTPLSRAGPTFLRRQWSKIERQSQPAVLYKKGAIDSGISETNLTLVFRLFQTIKIKAGLRWLPSSESCYVFLIWQG